MTTMMSRGAFRRTRIRLLSTFGAAAPLLLALGGCSYLEAQSRPAVDNRVELGWQERRSLYASEITDYKCPAHFMLRCERGGAVTYSCTCAMR